MVTAKQILLFTTQIFCIACFAQTKTIDSLKKILPLLKDTARIDCLNEVVFYYLNVHNKDSLEPYLSLAYSEAKGLNYVHGIAVSLAQKASMRKHYGNDPKMQELAVKSLQWYSLTNNKKYIELAYYQLGREFFAQSMWNKAMFNLKLSFEWAKKEAAQDRMLAALSLIGEAYRESSVYDSAFDIFKQELQMANQFNDTLRIEGALCNIGDLYQSIEDYPTALSYYGNAFKIAKRQDLTAIDYTTYAELFSQTHQYDSALHYYNFIDPAKTDTQTLPLFLISKGEYFLLQKEYKLALDYFLKGLAYHRQFNDINQIKRALLDIAKTYYGENNNHDALQYAHQDLKMAMQTNSRQYIRDAYQILYFVFDRQHKTDSAYFYYQKYITMKNAVLSDQIKGKFAAYSYEQKINDINKENLISQQQLKIQQQQLEKESLQKKILTGSIIGLLLMGTIVFRIIMLKRKSEKLQLQNELRLQRLQNEKTKVEMQQQATVLELQALRAQMNPHFIFNCLNSINRFIISNDAAKAADYLTKFAKLIRIVLQQSGKPFIPLEDELHCLQLYMDLEALRFEIPFAYEINCDGIDTTTVMIPTLLIQPFVENAIWHGLHAKTNGNGMISISMKVKDDILHCKICDNGIGRSAVIKEETDTAKKSLGINLTEHRLQLIDPLRKEKAGIEIHDLLNDAGHNDGTCVDIKIPVQSI